VKHIYRTGVTYDHHLRSSKYFYNTGSLIKIFFFKFLANGRNAVVEHLLHLPKVEGSSPATIDGSKNVIKNVVKIE
jgi:hypothetical protein